MKATILIADDDPIILKVLEETLRQEGYQTLTITNLHDLLNTYRNEEVDVVLLDVMFPEGSSLDILPQLIQPDKKIPVIMLTASQSVETAVQALKLGAYDYLQKPVDMERLLTVLDHACQLVLAEKEIGQLRQNLADKYQFENIIGESKLMRDLYYNMAQVVDQPVNVLIQAESGTGKELVARAIHYNSKRSQGPFITVNCAAIPENLIESELFGHEKGAFTGALARHEGKFEQADGGTIFLDEIGEMPLPAQARLLRVIQEREIERIGGKERVPVDVRIIAATNRILKDMVAENAFREDLFYRLNVFPLFIPPLRERKDDIPLIAAYLLQKYSDEMDQSQYDLSAEAMMILAQYSWPGNVRELENAIRRAMILAEGNTIMREHLSPELHSIPPGFPVERGPTIHLVDPSKHEVKTYREIEREIIVQALSLTGGNITEAAKRLELGRATLYRKMKEFGLEK